MHGISLDAQISSNITAAPRNNVTVYAANGFERFFHLLFLCTARDEMIYFEFAGARVNFEIDRFINLIKKSSFNRSSACAPLTDGDN